MADDPNELRRQIDGLQHQINEMKSVAEADKETRRAEMQAMRSDLAESLTRYEASNKEALAQNREAIARSEASNKEGLARNEVAISQLRVSFEQLQADMAKRDESMTKTILFAVLGAVGATAAVVALLEYAFRAT